MLPGRMDDSSPPFGSQGRWESPPHETDPMQTSMLANLIRLKEKQVCRTSNENLKEMNMSLGSCARFNRHGSRL